MLEVVEVGGVEGAAGGEDAEVGGVEHLDAHVREGAAGDDVELEQPQRGGGAGDDGVPGADAEGGGGRGEAGSVGPSGSGGSAMLGGSLGDDVDLFGSGAELGISVLG